MFQGIFFNRKTVGWANLRLFAVCSFFLSVLAFAAVGSVQAQEVNEAEFGSQAALETHDQITDDFSQLQFREKTQDALNSLVEEGVDALRNAGYASDAEMFERQWHDQFENFLFTIGGLGLGDHEPLSRWLADFYDSLNEKLGDRILQMLHLDDIRTLNYSLPVVFQPRGDHRNSDHWDRLEYSRHFVPFASVVTYWASYIGCFVATQKQPRFRRFCGQVASILRTGMRRAVAPKLSDLVYNAAVYGDANDELNIDLVTLRENYEIQISQLPLSLSL